MGLNSTIETVKKPLYLSMVGALYFSYAVAFLGIMYVNPRYVENLSLAIQIFICSFLIYKFHPLREHRLDPFDGTIIFASASLLLANMGLVEYVMANAQKHEKNFIKKSEYLYNNINTKPV